MKRKVRWGLIVEKNTGNGGTAKRGTGTHREKLKKQADEINDLLEGSRDRCNFCANK